MNKPIHKFNHAILGGDFVDQSVIATLEKAAKAELKQTTKPNKAMTGEELLAKAMKKMVK